MIKRSLYILIAAGMVFSFFFFYSRDRSNGTSPESPQQASAERALTQEISEFVIDGRSPRGAEKWRLEGVSAEIMEEKIRLSDLTAQAWTDRGEADLSSREGYYYRETGMVELIGDVEIESADGAVLRTERAVWEHNTNQVNTASRVYITRHNFEAEGTGGRANSELRTAQLDRDVVVRIYPDTQIVCSGPLMIAYYDNKAEFHDDVVVVDADGRLIADKLTVYFDADTRRLSEAVAEGDVKVKRGNSYTISEKAVYNESTASARLSGRVRMIIDPEQVEEFDKMGGFPGIGRRGDS